MPLRVYTRVKDCDFSKKDITYNNGSVKIHYKQYKKKYDFTINKIWNTSYNNSKIFHDLYSKSSHYFVSYWVAFGYTGSGKTYTTTNIIKELLNHLLLSTKSEVSISAIQIYEDDILDLINNNNKCKYFKTDKLIIKDNIRKSVHNADEIIKTILDNRTVASTKMNVDSSRSHAIITIYHEKKKYVIVDMAGQEFGDPNNKNSEIQKQANNINLNMLALKECIRAHHAKKPYIPYRRTLLTLAIKPLFEHNCNSAFICTVSLKQSIYYQIDSLRYASALFKTKDENNKKDNHYKSVFNDYCNYIEGHEWCNFLEKDIRQEMKLGDYKNVNQIENILNKKERYIEKLRHQMKSYEKL
jgi:hypothetical protein